MINASLYYNYIENDIKNNNNHNNNNKNQPIKQYVFLKVIYLSLRIKDFFKSNIFPNSFCLVDISFSSKENFFVVIFFIIFVL